MIARSLGVGALVMLRVAVSCLGGASGPSPVRRVSPPSRHVAAPHADALRPSVRPVYASAPTAAPVLTLMLVGMLMPSVSVAIAAPMARPPFVPPRA